MPAHADAASIENDGAVIEAAVGLARWATGKAARRPANGWEERAEAFTANSPNVKA